MDPRRLRTALLLGLLTLPAAAADQQCPLSSSLSTPPAGIEQVCPRIETPCEEQEEVGIVGWITGSHRMPTLHFLDFVEIFMR